MLPSGFKNEWPKNINVTNAYRLRNQENLYQPRTMTSRIDNMSYFSFPKLWNNTSPKVGSNLDAEVFLPALKSSLIYEYKFANTCNIPDCFSCKLSKNRIREQVQAYLNRQISYNA